MSRTFHPDFLSPDVLARPDFSEACAHRDLGAMLGIAIKWGGAGFSVSHVARRCEMTASQVTDYVRRGRQATRLEVFERVADGLHIPGNMLGVTNRPWESEDLVASDESEAASAQAMVGAYSGRGSITRRQWNRTIEGASEHVWLYGMAEFGYATDEEVPAILANSAGRGCDIRILLLDPEFRAVAEIDEDEGSPAGTLSTRIRAALARFERMREQCGNGFDIRIYDSHPGVSLVRGDDRIIVTPYLRFFTGSNSPTFEFRAGSASRIFERYERHFRHVWDLSKDWL
jgi:hypothetical protein